MRTSDVRPRLNGVRANARECMCTLVPVLMCTANETQKKTLTTDRLRRAIECTNPFARKKSGAQTEGAAAMAMTHLRQRHARVHVLVQQTPQILLDVVDAELLCKRAGKQRKSIECAAETRAKRIRAHCDDCVVA